MRPRAPWPTPTALAAAALTLAGAATLALGPGAAAERTERALVVETAAALAVFDARHFLIPDLYVASFALAGLAGPLSPGWPAALAGAAAGGGLLAAVRAAVTHALGREAMGWGDVKLASALGALLGPVPLLWTIALAAGGGAATAWIHGRRSSRPEAALTAFGAWLAPVGVAALCLRPPA